MTMMRPKKEEIDKIKEKLKDTVVLVVDDAEQLRALLAQELKKFGFNALQAENGTKAFEIVKSQKVHAIVSDVRMPGGDGLALLAAVKTHDKDLPVILMCGDPDLTAQDAQDRGALALFHKPFNKKKLFECILKCVT